MLANETSADLACVVECARRDNRHDSFARPERPVASVSRCRGRKSYKSAIRDFDHVVRGRH